MDVIGARLRSVGIGFHVARKNALINGRNDSPRKNTRDKEKPSASSQPSTIGRSHDMPTPSLSPNPSVATTTLPARPSLRASASTPAPPDAQNPPLPPPQTFDTLAPLCTLLSKLLPATPDAPPSLDPQHLATEAGAIKVRLRAARVAVESLGDMNRAIEEQEEEIRMLEEKCEKQREVLRGLIEVIKTGQATAMELD